MPQDGNQITHRFWQDVRLNLAQYKHQQDPSRNPRPQVSHAHRSYNHSSRSGGRNHIQRYLKLINGYPKSFIGSGGAKHSSSKYTQIPPNSWNVMDYVFHKGYPFMLSSTRNGADYALGVDARTMSTRKRKPNSNDLTSVHVALHPQFYYDSRGNIEKDQNGQPIKVTGRGAFTRFSEGYSSTKNPIISLMMDTEHIKMGQAFKEYKQMVEKYGPNTQFDPLDTSMKLPRSSSGETVTPNRNPHMTSSSTHNTQAQNYYDMDRAYRQAAKLGQHFLKDTQIGEKPLQALHDQGFTDQMIDDKKLGWFPNNNMLSRFTEHKFQDDAGIPIKSQLYKMDRNLHFSDRFNGQYTAPLTKNNRYIGIQGFDHEMQPTQKASYAGNYAYNALGNTMNGINKDYRDFGRRFNRKDAAGMKFAQGYLHGKRAISTRTVKRLVDTGMVRVNLGKTGDPKARKRAAQDKKNFQYLKEHAQEYTQAAGNQAYQELQKEYPNAKPEPHPEQVKKSLGKEALDKKERQINIDYRRYHSRGKTYAPCIEFPQYLDGNDKNGVDQGKRVPVGADRIYFQPGTDYERNHNFGQNGKMVARDSMHNYGYNINCGKNRSTTGKRELYVFEAPIDAISYVDLHRKELSDNPNTCDILSLSGSNAKTQTISNFIYNKVAATNDHYDKIYFGTDNDVHGQKTITDYTEKARNHWPKERVDHLFHGIVPPKVSSDAKDWNDVSKYCRAHPKEDVLSEHKQDYSMDEIRDKAIHDHLGQLSDSGAQHIDNINKLSKSLFVEYENHGENPHMGMSHDTIAQLSQEFDNMKDDNFGDAKAYHDFNSSIGESFNPYELDRNFSKNLDRPHPKMAAGSQVKYDSEHNPIIKHRKKQRDPRAATKVKDDESRDDDHKPKSSDSERKQPTSRAAPANDNRTSSGPSQDTKPTNHSGKTPEESAMPNIPSGNRTYKDHHITKDEFRRKYFAQEVKIKKQQEKQRGQEAAEKKRPKNAQVAQNPRWKRDPDNHFHPTQ